MQGRHKHRQCDNCLETLFRDQMSSSSDPNKSCTSQGKTEGIVWYAECMLRYANHPISHAFENSPDSAYNWSDSGQSDQVYPYLEPVSQTGLRNLLSALAKEAQAAGDKFAAGDGKKCDPNWSVEDCGACVAEAFRQIAPCCIGTQGFVLLPSCFLMYDTARFYNASAMSDGAPARIRLSSIFVSSVFSSEDEDDYQGFQFPYDTIQSATEDFHLLLGKGGFGPVYKFAQFSSVSNMWYQSEL
ncbi:hypothetical protein V2J09_019356 [Rumex salicifolius]